MIIFETERLRLETWGENAVSELMKLHGSLDVVRFLDATGTFYDRPKAEKGSLSGIRSITSMVLGSNV